MRKLNSMKGILAIAGLGLVTAMALVIWGERNVVAQETTFTPKFNDKGELHLPKGPFWREWLYVGSLVTPNALNNGNAPFPEHHMVYIDPVRSKDATLAIILHLICIGRPDKGGNHEKIK